jgi:hypothetical protein
LSEAKSGASLAVNPGFRVAQSGLRSLIPAHAGIQTGSPRSRGRVEIYRLLRNSDAAVQPRKDSHGMESPD